jgi:hypothetical protein
MNEPTLAAMGGAPTGYDTAAYGRDFKVFRAFAKQTVPTLFILGPEEQSIDLPMPAEHLHADCAQAWRQRSPAKWTANSSCRRTTNCQSWRGHASHRVA